MSTSLNPTNTNTINQKSPEELLSEGIDAELKLHRQSSENTHYIISFGQLRSDKFKIIDDIITHDQGVVEINKEILLQLIPLIHHNIQVTIILLCQSVDTYGDVLYENTDIKDMYQHQQIKSISKTTLLTQQQLQSIQQLWNDPTIQLCYQQLHNDNIIDDYFISNLTIIQQPTYIPTPSDYQRITYIPLALSQPIYIQTEYTTLVLQHFGHDCLLRWRFCLDWRDRNVFFILHIPLATYDQQHGFVYEREDFNSLYITGKPIIIFFSQIKEFNAKILIKPLHDYCPGYTGPLNEPSNALDWIRHDFGSQLRLVYQIVESDIQGVKHHWNDAFYRALYAHMGFANRCKTIGLI